MMILMCNLQTTQPLRVAQHCGFYAHELLPTQVIHSTPEFLKFGALPLELQPGQHF
jgi:hypothetical protein